MHKGIFWVLLSVSLLACNSSVNPPPPDKPTVSIIGSSGVLNGDLIMSTTTSVLGANEQNLAVSTTGIDGSFEAQIKTGSGSIFVCLSNGAYFEPALSANKPMLSSKLCVVFNYQTSVYI